MTVDTVEAVAVIPARGGSKGIPRKNLQRVGGRSLVRRSIEAALAATKVNHVVVSTDDDEIASEARGAGATIVERPESLSGDTATSESAVLHALDHIYGDPSIVLLVQATSPFLWAGDLDRLVDAVTLGEADCAFTVTPWHGFIWSYGPAGAEGVSAGSNPRQRRQDLPPQFLETGAAYAMRVAGLRASRQRFFGRTEMVEIPAERSMEIDDPADLQLACDLAPRLDRAWLASKLPSPLGAVAFDFDGVMTDNLVTTDQEGRESIVSSRSDGMGIGMLHDAGVPMIVLSKERNPVTTARCAKIRLDVVQGVDDKVTELTRWLDERGIDPASAVYVGNDVNDLGCMGFVGCGVAVSDAHPEVLASASAVLTHAGGHGAVRELADAILARR